MKGMKYLAGLQYFRGYLTEQLLYFNSKGVIKDEM